MAYTVAFDKGRDTHKAYMDAAQQPGIPTAFVVNQETKVVWIGHPLYPQGEIDGVLESVKAGKSSEADLKAVHEKVMEKQRQLDALEEKSMKALQSNDYDNALKSLDELLKLDPTGAVRHNMDRIRVLLTGKKDFDAGYKAASELSDGALKNDDAGLNELAWFILDEEGIEKRDFDLALKIAERANTISGGKDPAILDTLARAHFEKGNLTKAVELERLALEGAVGPMKAGIEEALAKYEKALKDKK